MVSIDDRVIGERLKSIRNSLGFTAIDIANRMGFPSYQTLLSIEKGERPLKASELSKLCLIYSKDIYQVLSPDGVPEVKLNFAWRECSKPQNPKAIESKISQILENYYLLEEITGENSGLALKLWDYSAEDIDYEIVKYEAQNLAESLNLGYRPGVNLPTILEDDYNLRIIYLEMGSNSSAVTCFSSKGKAIFINSTEPLGRRNFSLAHELFHVLSEKAFPTNRLNEYESDSDSKPEKFANAFAASLLLPKKSLDEEMTRRIKNSKISFIDLINIAQEFAVSLPALLWRLKHLNYFSEEQVQDILGNLNSLSTSGSEFIDDEPAIFQYSARFVSLALKALKMDKISKGKFCEIFAISKSEFSNFVASYGFSDKYLYEQEIGIDNT